MKRPACDVAPKRYGTSYANLDFDLNRDALEAKERPFESEKSFTLSIRAIGDSSRTDFC